jgi:diguanylate cyclase (GGDEF)-like protein
MGVRSRTIALVAVAELVLWLAMGSAAAVYAVRTSNAADAQRAVEGLDISSAAVATEQKRLVTICGDWAAWDDSYAFVKHPSTAYIRSNLTDSAIVNLEVDFMIYFDTSGHVVYSKAIDPSTQQVTALPDGLVRYLATQPALLHESDPRTVVSGALSLPEGPYLIAAQPIGRSDYSAPPDGTLVTGFRVDESILSTIEKVTRRPVGIYSSASPTLPADVASASATLAKPGAPDVVTIGEEAVAAYRTIAGVESQPGLVMRVTSPRSAFFESRAQLIGWGLALTAFGLGVVTVLGITLDRTVLRRLTALDSAVGAIGRSTNAETRVPVSGTDEIAHLAFGINRMLEDLAMAQSEMARLAKRDPLTGLFNRRHFENELRRELDEHLRLGNHGAVLWFDLDHFKEINDTLGHAAGDELLTAFGSHLQSETRAYCTTARLGGDEFGMLIPHIEGPDAIRAAVRLIAGFSARTFPVGGHNVHISASAGVVLYPEHGERTTDLLAHADIAMYDAKANGGNQVVAYAPDAARGTDMAKRLQTSEQIVTAMREDKLVLYAQPIRAAVDSGTRRFELLLRMHDEDGALVPAADIIPVAQRLGLIRDIDRWVARRGIELLALAQNGGYDVQFSINLSASALSDAALLDVIRGEFARTGASPERLIIEMTEATALADVRAALDFVHALREIGCRFSLDSFSSEASFYQCLKHLPIDFLKVDGSLVTGLSADSVDADFVRSIVEMCHGLKIATVAQSVESEQALDAVNQSGVDFVQGYLIGTPEPLEFYLGDRFAI